MGEQHQTLASHLEATIMELEHDNDAFTTAQGDAAAAARFFSKQRDDAIQEHAISREGWDREREAALKTHQLAQAGWEGEMGALEGHMLDAVASMEVHVDEHHGTRARLDSLRHDARLEGCKTVLCHGALDLAQLEDALLALTVQREQSKVDLSTLLSSTIELEREVQSKFVLQEFLLFKGKDQIKDRESSRKFRGSSTGTSREGGRVAAENAPAGEAAVSRERQDAFNDDFNSFCEQMNFKRPCPTPPQF